VLSQGEVDMIAVKAVEEPIRRLNRSLKLFDSTMIVAKRNLASSLTIIDACEYCQAELHPVAWH
jgi:hypothetical protein